MSGRVAVVGLGRMGVAVAACLARSGVAPLAWDIDPARTALAGEEGAEPCATAQALCGALGPAGPALWFSAVTDGDALGAVCFGDMDEEEGEAGLATGIVPHLPAGSVHVCLGTIGTACAEALAERHRAAGQYFVASPVFGRPDEAWAGDLTAVVGVPAGLPADRLAAVRQALAAFAPRVFEVPGPGAAYAVKLAGNGLIASAVAALTEALSLVCAHGVDTELAHAVFTAKLFRGPVYEGVGQAVARSVERVTTGEDAPADAVGFTIALGLKDLRLADEAARASQVAMPIADAARASLAAANDAGQGGRDWGKLAEALATQRVTKR
ncbi:MAG: NAD(P)-dependent oxidoreductase [Pseudacidovorax sp.]|nr:NAD(P)-dependent oxidoreductase [Pseudacidovorax sp.]